MHRTLSPKLMALAFAAALSGCGGGGSSAGTAAATDAGATGSDSTPTTATETISTEPADDGAPVDITDLILQSSSANCGDYAGDYTAAVQDIQRSVSFTGSVLVSAQDGSCTLVSNGIPNHDFDDESAHFAHDAAAIEHSFNIPISPLYADTASPLSQTMYDAVMLNGVVLDLLAAGCYRPGAPGADVNGNVAIGCTVDDGWLLDPLSPYNDFGTDRHNAHVQPDGRYHYHGNPMALFDDNPGPNGSPVIGFAADGFPIYGSYFLDPATGTIRKAVSGYTLRTGNRPMSDSDPGGEYNGMYVDDYEFTDAGDLDACNGMVVNGQYGYYVTDTYPWVMGCLRGQPDESFYK